MMYVKLKTKRNSWLRFERLSDLVGVWLEISQVRHVWFMKCIIRHSIDYVERMNLISKSVENDCRRNIRVCVFVMRDGECDCHWHL